MADNKRKNNGKNNKRRNNNGDEDFNPKFRKIRKKVCVMCANKDYVLDYKNPEQLKKFISKLFSDLHNDNEVKKVSLESDKKEERIKKYLEYQEKLNNRSKKNNHIEYLYNLYHEKYCVKKENVRYNNEEIRKRQEESMDKWCSSINV